MTDFVKLTRAGTRDETWVNPAQVRAIYAAPDGAQSATILSFGEHHVVGVQESPAEAAAILAGETPKSPSAPRRRK